MAQTTTNKSKHEATINFLSLLPSKIGETTYKRGHKLYEYANVQVLTQGNAFFEFDVEDEYQDFKVSIKIQEEKSSELGYFFETKCNCKSKDFCSHKVSSLLEMRDLLKVREYKTEPTGK